MGDDAATRDAYCCYDVASVAYGRLATKLLCSMSRYVYVKLCRAIIMQCNNMACNAGAAMLLCDVMRCCCVAARARCPDGVPDDDDRTNDDDDGD